MSQKVVIMGAGEIGRALAGVLNEKRIAAELWDKDEKKVSHQKPLSGIIPTADFIFLCIPSWVFREGMESISGYLRKETILISLTKGIEASSLKTVPEMIEELAPGNSYAVLGGPMLAEELVRGRGGRGVIGSKSRLVFENVKSLFSGTDLMMEWSTDVRGVALAGIVKNIYAVALGIVSCFGWGDNLRGWFLSQAFQEMLEIVSILGGKPVTALGPAGLGDLVATGFSPYSRNRRAGDELVRTGKCLVKSEGLLSLPSLLTLLGKKKDKFPLLKVLEKVCINGENAKKVFIAFQFSS